MIEILFDIIFEFILEGSFGAVGDKKVPLPLRITAAVIITVVFGGLVGTLIYIGINEKNWVIIICGVIIALIVITAIVKTVKKHRK